MRELDVKLYLIKPVHEEECNVYLIKGERQRIFIDSGMRNAEIKKYAVQACVINTHSHFGHVLNNYLFSKAFMHPLAGKKIRQGDIHLELLNEEWNVRNAVPEAIMNVQDNDVLHISGFKFQIIYTPGHSPDSISIYEPDKKWLFTGDTYCNGKLYYLHDSRVREWKDSLEKLSCLDAKLVLPGHNEVLEGFPDDIDAFFAEKVTMLQ